MLRLASITVLILLGAACSRTELAYRNADWLLERYARQSVSASAAQRDRWQPVLAQTLQRHREQELPLVVAYLDLAAEIARDANVPRGADCLLDAALLLAQRHARLAVELAVPLLAELDDGQVAHLSDYLADSQHTARERYLDPDPQRRQHNRQQRIIERIEAWTGKLDAEQRQLVTGALERIPDLSAAWLDYRAQQSQRLVAMLEDGSSATALHQYLTQWWVERRDRSAHYQAQWQTARREFVVLLDELNATLSEHQRNKLDRRLETVREDLAGFLPPEQTPVSLPPVFTQCAPARA